MSEIMQSCICIALLAMSAFLVAMTAYVFTLAWRASGMTLDKKKAVETVEEKERRERNELAKAKVGKII